MFHRLFKQASTVVSSFQLWGNAYSYPTVLKVPTILSRRDAMLGLSQAWPELSVQKVNISRSQMLPLKKLNSDVPYYQLGFATKKGLPVPYFPISHSAICFYSPDENKFFVLGRQSPFALNIKNWNQTTHIDNEEPYLSNEYEFHAIMSHATFSEQEIKQMINQANNDINQSQLCDMKYSNCYSSATYMMSIALECMTMRQDKPSKEAFQSMLKILSISTQDHLSIGVLNNEVVVDKITSALTKANLLDKDKFLDDYIQQMKSIEYESMQNKTQ